MELEHRICRQAMRSRDPRFDGRFFIGVLTTGIYCRPICRVRAPKAENVRFFPTAAAAAAAGLRPCLRCRPETSPGTPAWTGSAASVSRALRLISDGALERGSVEQLAGVLGIGTRHLDRLFRLHVGASPLAVARTRRLHAAKRLIDETTLPMTRVSTAAGFGSLRSFNAALRQVYGRTPSALRRAAHPRAPGRAGALSITLALRPPYDWDALIRFLALRAIPTVECVTAGAYARTIELDGHAGSIRVRPADEPNRLRLDVEFPDPAALCTIVARVRRIFDLDAAPDTIGELLGRDPLLARSLARHPGLRVPGAWDPFEIAVRAILGQQITVKGATTLAGRLVQRFGAQSGADDASGLSRLFPRAEELAQADLGGLGIVGTRVETIRELSRAVLFGELDFSPASDLDRFVEALTRIRGVGPWTAHYVALRALCEPDAFPAGDLGLLRAGSSNGTLVTPRTLLQQAERWRPWRAYAAMHLWAGDPANDPIHDTTSRTPHGGTDAVHARR